MTPWGHTINLCPILKEFKAILIHIKNKPTASRTGKKQVSLNTLSNQIFTDHIVWHNYARQTGLFYVPKPLISRATNGLTLSFFLELSWLINMQGTKSI